VIRFAVFAAVIVGGSVWLGLGPRAEDVQAESEIPLDQLRALGYVESVEQDPEPERRGVVLHDEKRAWEGINAYCSVLTSRIQFLDMKGRELHSLQLPGPGRGADCHVAMEGDGIFILTQPHLRRLDWSSRVVWTSSAEHHHDFHLASTGEIYTLSTRLGAVQEGGRSLPIWDEGIVVLDRSGRKRRELWLSPLLEDRIPRGWLKGGLRDVLHANGIERVEHPIGVGRPGNVLVSLRELDLLVIVDLEAERVVWSWGPGQLDRPHHPTILPSGNILVFDNGWHRGFSRVIEVDPRHNRIVWEYRAEPPDEFFTQLQGSVEALPNGNRLVTETQTGRVFEVGSEGKIVWDFWNPDRTPSGARRQIYRMMRLSREEWDAFRSSAKAP